VAAAAAVSSVDQHPRHFHPRPVCAGVYWTCGLVEIHWGDVASRRWTTRERVRLELIGLLILIALIITPYGSELLLYPLDLASSQQVMIANIIEWQPMTFNNATGKIFLIFLLAFLIAQFTLRLRWRLEEVVVASRRDCRGLPARASNVDFRTLHCSLVWLIMARWVEPYVPAKDKYVLNAALMTLWWPQLWASSPRGLIWRASAAEVAGAGSGVPAPAPCPQAHAEQLRVWRVLDMADGGCQQGVH